MKDRDAFLEDFIFDKVTPHQRKIAFIVGTALSCGYSEKEVAGKIYMMCVEGKLKTYGNILKWRHSEVGLPDVSQDQT